MTGRNTPCPCGSGRKYKNCHYAADTASMASAASDVTSPHHGLDNRLVEEMATWAMKKFPGEFTEAIEALGTYPDMTAQLGGPWLVYVCSVEGRPVVDWYLDERRWSLSRGACEWLERQQQSWLSIWEVLEVHSGRGLVLRDVLTGEQRSVHEVSASKAAKVHFMFLGRVVDAGSVSVICGMHPNPLRPLQGAEVVEQVRRMLRRKTAVPPDRLRDPRIAWKMLQSWSDALEKFSAPPRFQNTDGDPVLLTRERWSFDPEHRTELVARIANIAGAQPEEAESGDAYTIVHEGNRLHKDWDNTIVARLEIADSVLSAETNSVKRADDIKLHIESAGKRLLRKGVRTHTDPTSACARAALPADLERPESTPEAQAIVREFKERHYARWLDEQLPALDGKTPRNASRTKSGREQLTRILNEVELTESHEPEAARFNVRKLRHALGLPV